MANDKLAAALRDLLDEVSDGDELWSHIEVAVKNTGRSPRKLREIVMRGRRLLDANDG